MPKKKSTSPLEWGIVAILGLMLCLGPLLFGGVYASGFLLLTALCVVASALWLILIISGKRYRLLWPPICWLVLAFMCFALWRYRFVQVPYAGEYELMRILLYGTLFFSGSQFFAWAGDHPDPFASSGLCGHACCLIRSFPIHHTFQSGMAHHQTTSVCESWYGNLHLPKSSGRVSGDGFAAWTGVFVCRQTQCHI